MVGPFGYHEIGYFTLIEPFHCFSGFSDVCVLRNTGDRAVDLAGRVMNVEIKIT